jgi:glutamate carboxypeptidase
MRSVLMAAGAALVLTGAAQALPKPQPKDAKVAAAAQAARDGELKLLEQVVNVDSGTGDVEGGQRIAEILIPRLQALGMTVEKVPAEAPGLPDNIVGRLSGTGKGRILMIGHLDTVFEHGAVAQRPFRIEGDHARGPGVSDEKGGVIEGVTALQILHGQGFKDFGQITFLIETSEEKGSPGAEKLIRRLLQTADAELNLEPGDPPDVLTVWRKGATTLHVMVKGRAAHAGIAPQDGRNAATELIHQIQADDVFPHSGDGITANLTVVNAGTRANIIPDSAEGQVNVRVRERAQYDEVQAVFEKNAKTTVVPDTQVSISRERSFPPLSSNPGTDGLAERAQAIYGGVGLSIGTGGNGGASESALALDEGVAALDGLGPVGGGFHSEAEYLDIKTMTPRLYLLTELIMDIGRRPPARLK